MFLTGPDYVKALQKGFKNSNKISMAVAYWGFGATESLGITPQHDWRIVCNLLDGRTNPSEIEILRNQRKDCVFHSSRLHAKVFLFENFAVFGSANASKRGLSSDVKSRTALFEAGLLVQDAHTLAEIANWIEFQFGISEIVSDKDIILAKLKYGTKSPNRNEFSTAE